MRRKSHELPNSTQHAIGREYIEGRKAGRDVTYASIARKYNCTIDQARSYAAKYKRGAYAGRQTRVRRNPAGESSTTIEELIRITIDELGVTDLDPLERSKAIERLVRSMHSAQQISLQGHMRSTDAMLVRAIVRRYEPDATDEDVIRIIREERENATLGC